MLAATLATLTFVPSAGAASPINCDASALRVSVLGTAIEPVTANRGKTACSVVSSSLVDTSGLGVPLVASALTATTKAGGANDQQKAIATGGVAGLQLGALPALGLPDLTSLIPANLLNVSVPLGSIAAIANPILLLAGLPALPSSINVGLGNAVKDLVAPLPNVSVLSAGALNAFAGATCVNGKATPFAAPQIADISVLGQAVGADGLVNSALSILNTQSIDLSKLDVSKLVLPQVISDLGLSVVTQPVLTLVTNLIKTTLSALPPIQIPAVLADVSVVPGAKTVSGTLVTQHALDVHVALLGQTLIDGTIGEARVNTAGVDCSAAAASTPQTTPAAQQTATQLTLQCTKRKVVLTEVYQRGDHVTLVGAADRKLAGQLVTIRFDADGSTVAQTLVRRDGSFTAEAPLPARDLRAGNSARYTAIIGKQKSLNLKLARRMVVTKMTSGNGKVTITGYLTRPLSDPLKPIVVQRRVSCTKNATVTRVMPRRDGRFSVTVDAPSGTVAAVYRLKTQVRKSSSNPKLFDTFTLPRGVNLS